MIEVLSPRQLEAARPAGRFVGTTLAELRRSASAKEVHSASARSGLAVMMKRAPGYMRASSLY